MRLRFDITTPIMLVLYSAFYGVIAFVLFGLFVSSVRDYYSGDLHSYSSGGVFVGPVAVLPLLFAVGLLRTIFLRIRLDLNAKTLSVPFWRKIDSHHEFLFGNSYRWTSNLYFAAPLISRNRAIPLSDIHSVLICRLPELKNYIDKFTDNPDAQKKILEYLALYSPSAIKNLSLASLAGLSLPRNPAGFLVGAGVVMAADKFETPPWILLVETRDVTIISKLNWFLDSDPPYLAEKLRSLGVNVVNPINEKISAQVAAGHLLPERNFMNASMKLFIVFLMVLVFTIYFAAHHW